MPPRRAPGEGGESMSGKGRSLLIGLCVMGMGLLAVAPAAAQTGDAPKATEVGVTAKEIHIAVIADVDNPFAPGLFKGAVDGVKGAAKYINSKAGGGGIAGRKLVVDFIDSKLTPNDARNGVITACQQDYAMVGTFALFLSNMDDATNCKDQAGATTGLPDFASVTTGVVESCSPLAFPVSPPALDCSTKDQHPQTYHGNQYDSKYLLRTHKNDLHGAMIVSGDTKDANRGGTVLVDTAQQAGIKSDQDVTIGGRDPQSAYTPIVNKMKTDGSNYSYNTSAANSAILLRSEAQLQGLTDPNIVWTCTIACYDKSVKEKADVMNGEYIPMTFLPFEEASTNKTLAAFLKYVGTDNANGFAVYGWTATLAFQQAVNAIVAKEGVNGLTRTNLLSTGVDALTSFDAGGMIGTVDIKNKVPTPCLMVDQLQKGKFARVSPAKKGTFDCKKSNAVTIKADLIG
jgi:Periplasmic binding protein